MYTACAFENAWYIDKRSPWCAAFTKDEEEVFEYEEDLSYYYYSSYGEILSSVIGCPPLQDMFNHFTWVFFHSVNINITNITSAITKWRYFRKLENGDSNEEPQGVFYFAHSTTLQLFLTTMEIAKDSVPLKASNYESMRNRKWRTSHLAPFAANLAAVFYKYIYLHCFGFYLKSFIYSDRFFLFFFFFFRCDSSNRVRFYLNEKPLDYEGCEAGVCDWEYLKKKLRLKAFNCDTNICTKWYAVSIKWSLILYINGNCYVKVIVRVTLKRFHDYLKLRRHVNEITFWQPIHTYIPTRSNEARRPYITVT